MAQAECRAKAWFPEECVSKKETYS